MFNWQSLIGRWFFQKARELTPEEAAKREAVKAAARAKANPLSGFQDNEPVYLPSQEEKRQQAEEAVKRLNAFFVNTDANNQQRHQRIEEGREKGPPQFVDPSEIEYEEEETAPAIERQLADINHPRHKQAQRLADKYTDILNRFRYAVNRGRVTNKTLRAIDKGNEHLKYGDYIPMLHTFEGELGKLFEELQPMNEDGSSLTLDELVDRIAGRRSLATLMAEEQARTGRKIRPQLDFNDEGKVSVVRKPGSKLNDMLSAGTGSLAAANQQLDKKIRTKTAPPQKTSEPAVIPRTMGVTEKRNILNELFPPTVDERATNKRLMGIDQIMHNPALDVVMPLEDVDEASRIAERKVAEERSKQKKIQAFDEVM